MVCSTPRGLLATCLTWLQADRPNHHVADIGKDESEVNLTFRQCQVDVGEWIDRCRFFTKFCIVSTILPNWLRHFAKGARHEFGQR